MMRLLNAIGQRWAGLTCCCFLVIGAFYLGYWQGHRTQTQASIPGAAIPGALGVGATNSVTLGFRPPLPAGASPEMKEFLENRAKLTESLRELRSQGANGAPNPQVFAVFQQQNKALLERQRQLAQILGQQHADQPFVGPPPLQIPPSASPQLRNYLTAREQLMREQIALMNQHRTDAPQARQTAIQQWRQQNATRFAQLQQMAQALSQTNSTDSTELKKTN